MILAAGRGDRMGALTAATPKPLLSVDGRPIVDYALAKLRAAGVTRLVANLHHHGGQIRAHLTANWPGEICFSDESDELLETGGGIFKALGLLGTEPFFAVNGDALWLDDGESALARLAAAFRPGDMLALLLLQPKETALSYSRAGDFDLDGDGRIARPGTFVFTGVQLLDPVLFAGAPDGPFSVNLLYDAAIGKGRLYGLVHQGQWMEINTPEGIAAAEAALRGA